MTEILEQNRKWQCHFQSPAFSTWDVKRQQQQQQSPRPSPMMKLKIVVVKIEFTH